MTKDEMKNRISLALKDPILQIGFELICKQNTDLKAYNEKLLNGDIEKHNKIVELEAQIEKMKCCEMCKHKNFNWGFSPICEARDKIKIENPLTCKCDKWEIKEK